MTAVPYKQWGGQQFYVWCGRVPTKEEWDGAPSFTLFIGAPYKGYLLMEAGETVHSGDEYEGEIPYAYIGSRVDPPYLEDARVRRAVEAFIADPATPRMGPPPLEYFPDFPGELEGKRKILASDFGVGRTVTIGWDESHRWALEAGYTMLKVPDGLDEPEHYYVHPVDRVLEGDDGISFFQTDLRDELTEFCKALGALPSDDLEVINRHRASLGMRPIDPAAGWTPQELADMAESIRKTGRMTNPDRERLKRKLMR